VLCGFPGVALALFYFGACCAGVVLAGRARRRIVDRPRATSDLSSTRERRDVASTRE